MFAWFLCMPFYLTFFIISVGCLAQDLTYDSQQAIAFFKSQNYLQALTIYETLSEEHHPSWQQAIISYNLGTVKLSQKRWQDALDHFNTILGADIATLQLWQALNFNQSVAYLKKAHTFRSTPLALINIGSPLFFLERAQQLAKQSEKIACYIQTAGLCQPAQKMIDLQEHIAYEMQIIKQSQRDQIFNKASPTILNYLLQEEIQNLLMHFEDIPQETDDLIFLAMALESVWQKVFPHDQKSYQEIIQAIKNKNLDQAKELLQQVHLQLPTSLEKLQFNYRLALLQDHLEYIDWSRLQSDNNLPEELQEQLNRFLQLAQEQLQQGQTLGARFFLTYAAHLLQKDHLDTPRSILESSLNSAVWTLQLDGLAQLQPSQTFTYPYLQKAHLELMQKADQFIPQVLKTQQEAFQKGCQQSPWDQVIPLFETGYSEASAIQKTWFPSFQMTHSTLSAYAKVIEAWSQALEKMEQSSKEPPPAEAQQEDIEEVFRVLQEMDLEDRPATEKTSKELDTW